jgi:alpha-glucosidase
MPQAHRVQAVSRQAVDPASTLNAYRAFMRFRRAHAPLRLGSIRFLDAPEQALCFLREHEGRALFAAFNFGAAPVTVTLPAGAAVTPLAGHGFDPCMPAGGRVTLPAAGAFFATVAP